MADMGTSYLYGIGGAEVNREDVMNAIVNVDPFDTPLLNMCPKVQANHTTVEWLEHTLDSTANVTAGRPEGQGFVQDAITVPSRKTNYTQIFGQHVVVSETQQVVSPYGFSDTFLYEIMRKTRNVMRGIEISLMRASGSYTSVVITAYTASATADARKMKSLQDFLTTNNQHVDDKVLGLSDATASAACLSERAVNAMLQLIYEQGGNPTHLFVSPAAKRQVSTFSGNISRLGTGATVNLNAADQQIVRSVNGLVTDFGMINVVLDRWCPQGDITALGATDAETGQPHLDGTAFFLELPRIQVAFLRPIRFKRLAEDGDRVRGMVLGELTLKVLAEKAHGKLFGINNLV